MMTRCRSRRNVSTGVQGNGYYQTMRFCHGERVFFGAGHLNNTPSWLTFYTKFTKQSEMRVVIIVKCCIK